MTYGNLLIHSFIISGSERPLGLSRPQTAARLLCVIQTNKWQPCIHLNHLQCQYDDAGDIRAPVLHIVLIVSVTSLTCVQPCSGCSRVLCQTGGGWLERAGAASHKSLSSPLSASRAGAEPSWSGPLLPTQQCQCVVPRGAYKTSHFNTTEFIFTVIKIQIRLHIWNVIATKRNFLKWK